MPHKILELGSNIVVNVVLVIIYIHFFGLSSVRKYLDKSFIETIQEETKKTEYLSIYLSSLCARSVELCNKSQAGWGDVERTTLQPPHRSIFSDGSGAGVDIATPHHPYYSGSGAGTGLRGRGAHNPGLITSRQWIKYQIWSTQETKVHSKLFLLFHIVIYLIMIILEL